MYIYAIVSEDKKNLHGLKLSQMIWRRILSYYVYKRLYKRHKLRVDSSLKLIIESGIDDVVSFIAKNTAIPGV